MAGDEVSGLKGLDVPSSGDRHIRNPAGADSGLTDGLRRLFGSQRLANVPTVANFVIYCHESDPALSLERAAGFALGWSLVDFQHLQEVGPLLLELRNNSSRTLWSRTSGYHVFLDQKLPQEALSLRRPIPSAAAT